MPLRVFWQNSQVAALSQFIFGCFRSAVAVRETAVAAIYAKCLRLATSAIGSPSPGVWGTRPCESLQSLTTRCGSESCGAEAAAPTFELYPLMLVPRISQAAPQPDNSVVPAHSCRLLLAVPFQSAWRKP